MSLLVLVGVGLLGGTGAVARAVLDAAVTRRAGTGWPVGILAVNVSGSLALGVLTGAGVTGDGAWLVGTGALGGFTTFSTWMLDTHRLGAGGRRGAAALNVGLSLAAGVLAAWAGRSLGAAW
jgi:CrcB protein